MAVGVQVGISTWGVGGWTSIGSTVAGKLAVGINVGGEFVQLDSANMIMIHPAHVRFNGMLRYIIPFVLDWRPGVTDFDKPANFISNLGMSNSISNRPIARLPEFAEKEEMCTIDTSVWRE